LFVGMAMSLPERGAPVKVLHLGRLLSYPQALYYILERLARGKHFSLLRKFVTYVGKKFYNIGPWVEL